MTFLRRNKANRRISAPLVALIFAVLCLLLPQQVVANEANPGSRDIVNTGTLFYRHNNQRASESSNQVVVGFNGGPLQVEKTVDKDSALPGDSLNYEVVALNSSEQQLSGIAIEVDGVSTEAIVLRDSLPANTRFQSANAMASGPSSARLLYHSVGDPLHSYSSTAPAAEQIDAVAAVSPELFADDSIALRLQVIVNDNASNTLRNTAQGFSATTNTDSNTVSTQLPNRRGKVQFSRGDSDTTNNKPASRANTGEDIFISVDAAGCNTRSDVAEQYPIEVTTTVSGDSETFTAVETGPNTGYFEVKKAVPLRSTRRHAVEANNEKIEADNNDELVATLTGCDADVENDSVLIDPLGVVFDSRSNQPIAGAVVTLIDVDGNGNGGNPGGPARVFADDGTTPAPSTVTTDEDGFYQFPQVAPSRYRLQITPPEDYQFPSQVPAGELPDNRIIDTDGSYGREFIVSEETGARTIDVPLDLITSQLFVNLSLSQTSVQPADVVRAEVTVSNRSNRDTEDTTLNIEPPPGFRIVPGSVRLGGEELPGFDDTYGIGTLPANSDVLITFQLEALASASTGAIAVNATGSSTFNTQTATVTSNTARQQIRVLNVLGESYVIGTVYLECDGNFEQNRDDPGIPGVRLYLEDGSYTITDADGRYSVYGLSTGSHVIKLDRTTLPVGSRAKPIDFRHAGDGNSRFIDLKAGELHKANFTLFCTDSTKAAVQRRIERSRALPGNLRSAADQPLNAIDELTLSPQRAVSRENRQRRAATRRDAANASLAAADVLQEGDETKLLFADIPVAIDLKSWFEGQDKALAFIDLEDGDIAPLSKVTVRLKASSRATVNLRINGEAVSPKQLGQRAADPRSGVGFWEYVGVSLRPGNNRLSAETVDSFGNVREQVEITLQLPGKATQLAMQFDSNQLIANGNTPLAIAIQAQDDAGLPTNLNAPITLQTTTGLWASDDIDPGTPGLQVMAVQGRATAQLLPPREPVRGVLKASIGSLSAEKPVAFRANLRPMLAVGLVEGVIAFGKSSPLQNDAESQLFERELTALADSADDGNVRFGGRAALFMKGEVAGDALLTLRYDSEDNNDQLFRDIEPQRHYPIYGDAAERGFDARSTSQLFARLERDNNYLQYGDMVTDANSDAAKLGNVRRSLTGVQAHVENDAVSATAFASRDSSEQQLDEIPAQGVSGPYQLSNTAIRGGSETVELITRDRERPGVIINIVPQIRFTDYVLDPLSGELIFRRPVNSVDRDLNPVSIRVRYEVNSGGEDYWVGGVQADIRVNDKLTVGGGWVRNNTPDTANSTTARDVQNVHAKLALNDSTRIEAEVARTADSDGSAIGWRTGLQHRSEKLDVTADLSRVDADFNNAAAGVLAGREEARLRSRYKLNERQSVQLDALHSKDLSDSGEQRDGVAVSGRHEFDNAAVELGARHTRSRGQNEDNNVTSLRGRAESRLPFVQREHRFFLEAEQDINNSKRRLLAVGGNMQLHPEAQLYARHEVASTETGVFGLEERNNRHSTVLGINSEYFDNGQLFSEYRARDSISGREAEAAIGLRNQWQLSDHSSINIAAERISPLGGVSDTTRTALGFGFQYADAESRSGTARLEWRETEAGYSWFSTLGLAARMNNSLSLLARNTLSIRRGGDDLVEDRLQLGLAWRDSGNDSLHALARYEWRLRDSNREQQQAQLLTTHVNWQPRRDVQLSGSYGIRHVDARSADNFRSSTDAQAVFGRINWRAFERVDIGLQAGVLGSNGLSDRRYGSGVELGYLLHSNLWLAAGYNFTGLNDEDFGGSTNQQGSYLRLRFKFDENLFGSQP